MRYLITSDTHFGHKNIIEYCWRPKNFEEIIKDNLIEETNIDDVLIHLWDVCFGNDRRYNNWFKNLQCRKILVRGNHDKKTNGWYMNNGWDFVCDTFSLVYDNKIIVFSHQPLPVWNYYDINIHWHLHEKSLFISDKHKLISLEKNGYRLENLENIIK